MHHLVSADVFLIIAWALLCFGGLVSLFGGRADFCLVRVRILQTEWEEWGAGIGVGK
jgi:hypothetical protein